MSGKAGRNNYPSTYPEECFQAWYAAGHPNITKGNYEKIIPFHNGGRPAHQTIRSWANVYQWREKAEELDKKALIIVEQDLIDQKVAVLKKQFEEAQKLKARALGFLTDSEMGFDSSASAVQAYFKAAEQERNSIGLAEALAELSKLTKQQLNKKLEDLLSRVNVEDGEVIEESKEKTDETN